VNSRKAARQAVAGLIATIPALADSSFAYEVLDPGGKSPLATVHSFGTQPAILTMDSEIVRRHALIITLYWRWTDTTEDKFDDLSEVVHDTIEANPELDGVWQSLELDDAFTETGYETIDNKDYRIERIRVFIW